MRTFLDCVPCFVRQALDAARKVTNDEARHEELLRLVLATAADMDLSQSPPAMGMIIHRKLRELTGGLDPFAEDKRLQNETALKVLPRLQRCVTESQNRFDTAVRLAIAGNVIDLGLRHSIPEDEVHRAIETALHGRLDGSTEALREAADQAEHILYIADNAGEIVFDRLLIEQLPTDRVTVAVRGVPVINDATMEDAEAAGLTSLVTVIDNGSDAPGTILETCSEAFRNTFWEANLVIAKGQGNYETLSETEHNIHFLLKAKCPVIAAHLDCPLGSFVARRPVRYHRTPC